MHMNSRLRGGLERAGLDPKAHSLGLNYSLNRIWLEVPKTVRLGVDNVPGYEREPFSPPRLEYRRSDRPFKKVELGNQQMSKCFWAFLDLADASDEKILAYVQKY